MTRPSKPVVFVASPYTKGDVAVNVNFQCAIFDRLMSEGLVLPYVPLWSHFQHTLFPRPYADWIAYDQEMLKLCDCCLRLDSVHDAMTYRQAESSGADGEVAAFRAAGKPIFFSFGDLYAWVREQSNGEQAA